MQCPQCHKLVRNSDGVRCSKCDFKYHLQCVNDIKEVDFESGDRKHHWVCNNCELMNKTNDTNQVYQAINSLTEKMELINKIQLPKLNNDLLQVKCAIERIAKQNEYILKQFERHKDKFKDTERRSNSLQRRSLNLSPRSPLTKPCLAEQLPILGSEKARHRTRRKSYPLFKILLQINKRILRNRVHRGNK